MSTIIGDTGCPRCIENGRDKTQNHLMLFEDGGAYCNRCGYADNWKEKDIPVKERKEITDEELRELLEEFEGCNFSAYADRGISRETAVRYGCRAGVHPSNRDKIGNTSCHTDASRMQVATRSLDSKLESLKTNENLTSQSISTEEE